MRAIIFIAALSLVVAGCDQGGSFNPLLTADFRLSDTSGHPSAAFRSGNDFVLSFALLNTTKKTLTFYRGDASPDIIFKIVRQDTVLATSVDGYAFIQVPSSGSLAPGQLLQGSWRAPTTPAQFPRRSLIPGQYRAEVFYPRFEQADIEQTPAIGFTIY